MKWTDNGGHEFEQPPVGTHIAICTKVIDIGTQKGEYQGKTNFKRQVIIGWELPNELMTVGDYAGKPFTVSRFYTSSLSEKANLRADLVNWRGREFTEQELQGFESRDILGKPCMLSIVLNDKNKAKVKGVIALPRGSAVPPQVNPSVYFSLEEFDQDVFDSLSDGIKNIIMLSPEYKNLSTPEPAQEFAGDPFEDMADDLPFN